MCPHNRLKCTNNVFYCMDCGAVVQYDPAPSKVEQPPEPAPEKKRPGRKAKTS